MRDSLSPSGNTLGFSALWACTAVSDSIANHKKVRQRNILIIMIAISTLAMMEKNTLD